MIYPKRYSIYLRGTVVVKDCTPRLGQPCVSGKKCGFCEVNRLRDAHLPLFGGRRFLIQN